MTEKYKNKVNRNKSEGSWIDKITNKMTICTFIVVLFVIFILV